VEKLTLLAFTDTSDPGITTSDEGNPFTIGLNSIITGSVVDPVNVLKNRSTAVKNIPFCSFTKND
jgi:hypothetical protein